MLALRAIDKLQNTIYFIEAQASQEEQKLAKLVSLLFKKQGSEVVTRLKRLHNLTENADSDYITKELDKGSSYMEAIESLVKARYLVGATTALGDFNTGISFDLKNPRAVAYFKNYGVDLLKELNSTTKASIKSMIENGLENGHSYDRIAREIKTKFESYAELPKRGPSHIRSRAQLVAVTELGNAYQQGNLDGLRSASATGLKFNKRWLTVGDKRVSAGCKDNQAAGWIDIDKEFPSGSDRPLRFPGCRCVLQFERDQSTPVVAKATVKPNPFSAKEFSTAKAADSYLTKNSAVKIADLDYFSQSAMQNYQHEGYKKFNGALRSGDKKALKENKREIDLIDGVMKKSKTTDDLYAYRGMYIKPGSSAETLFNSWEAGKTYREPGYMSATVDEARVNKFLKSIGKKDRSPDSTDVMIKVRVPKGTPSVYMNAAVEQRGITNYKEEKELLIERDTEYRVISKTQLPNGKWEMEIEIIPKTKEKTR